MTGHLTTSHWCLISTILFATLLYVLFFRSLHVSQLTAPCDPKPPNSEDGLSSVGVHTEVNDLKKNSLNSAVVVPLKRNRIQVFPPHQMEKLLNENNSLVELEALLFQSISQMELFCPSPIRLGGEPGTFKDGWKWLCLVDEFILRAPCIVYSIGINNDFSFDDMLSTKYGCHVFAFDPSMGVEDHSHSSLVNFYNLGLSNFNGIEKSKGWKMSTFGAMLRRLGHVEQTIDYFKVDIEGTEWVTIREMIRDGSLRRVKQLGVEIHFSFSKNVTDQIQIYRSYLEVLNGLRLEGFLLWRYDPNIFCPIAVPTTKNAVYHCHEIVYLNRKYF